MNKTEFIKRALDTTNGFILSESTEAQAVNPDTWNFRLREYEEANLVMVPLAESFDMRMPGSTLKVTIDEVPSEAAALVETTDVTISALTTRNITFTPTEYGAAYQLTRKEGVRAFFNVVDNMVKKLGYSLAKKKDSLIVSTATSGAGNAVLVNGVSAATDLASTDTLNLSAITKAIRLVEDDLYEPRYLVINPTQKQHLMDLDNLRQAQQFGTRDAIAKGLVGELFGLQVYQTTQIATTSNVATALLLGTSQTGENAVGYAIKRDPIIEQQYFARGRFWDVVAHEEYDVKVLHPNAICTIKSYA